AGREVHRRFTSGRRPAPPRPRPGAGASAPSSDEDGAPPATALRPGRPAVGCPVLPWRVGGAAGRRESAGPLPERERAARGPDRVIARIPNSLSAASSAAPAPGGECRGPAGDPVRAGAGRQVDDVHASGVLLSVLGEGRPAQHQPAGEAVHVGPVLFGQIEQFVPDPGPVLAVNVEKHAEKAAFPAASPGPRPGGSAVCAARPPKGAPRPVTRRSPGPLRPKAARSP